MSRHYVDPYSGAKMQANDAAGERIAEAFVAEGRKMVDETARTTRNLREAGIKAATPDDGWVDRDKNSVMFPSYVQFDDRPEVGDQIALGWPWGGYRLVTVTKIEKRQFINEYCRYFFRDDGERMRP